MGRNYCTFVYVILSILSRNYLTHFMPLVLSVPFEIQRFRDVLRRLRKRTVSDNGSIMIEIKYMSYIISFITIIVITGNTRVI